LQHATRLSPQSAAVWTRLGALLQSLKRFDEAVAACRLALNLAPERAESWYNLGCVFRDAGDRDQAEPLFREALKRDPNLDEARYFLALWGSEGVPQSAPAEYVKDLFDGYADKFDSHLTGNLEYRTPELLAQAIREACAGSIVAMDILDLGCGTGLAGVALRDSIRYLAGVDLSPKMVEKARARGIYDELIVGDIMTPLATAENRYDLIVSADVFVYVGDLSGMFMACSRALRAGGLFALSVEKAGDADGFDLRNSGRYAHGDAYIGSLANQAGFEEVIARDVALRKEKGVPMAGRIYVLRKPLAP
jgi:predicted TPR repeat methyltransferase